MRYYLGNELFKMAQEDDSIYIICADIGNKIFAKFIENFPDRYMNMGVSEQAIIGVAAGMALRGLKPYICTITPFLIERPFEQIKLDINEQKVNVKLIGYGNYINEGISHSVYKDKNIHPMNFFDNIKHFKPSNIEDLHFAIYDSYNKKYPAFFDLEKTNDELKYR